jgi:predicted nucleic acid-binding protein
MGLPSIVVVDTSAAVDLVVEDSAHHRTCSDAFGSLVRAGVVFAFNELLEAELLEAAYTWDVRRGGNADWRRRRRDGDLRRSVEREHAVLEKWRDAITACEPIVVPVRAVVDQAGPLMTRLGIGSYDAVHLATARRLGAPLITNDRLLARASSRWPGAIMPRETA